MRKAIVGTLAAAGLIVSLASAIGQSQSPDANATGQSERPTDPKQIEPESQAHNAEKPKAKKDSRKTSTSNQDKGKKPQ